MARNERSTEELRKNLADLKSQLREIEGSARDTMKEKAYQAQEKFEGKVQEKPMQSVGVAFGAGVLLGAIGSALMNRK